MKLYRNSLIVSLILFSFFSLQYGASTNQVSSYDVPEDFVIVNALKQTSDITQKDVDRYKLGVGTRSQK